MRITLGSVASLVMVLWMLCNVVNHLQRRRLFVGMIQAQVMTLPVRIAICCQHHPGQGSYAGAALAAMTARGMVPQVAMRLSTDGSDSSGKRLRGWNSFVTVRHRWSS